MEDAESVMGQVLAGELGPERLAALVTAMRAKPLDAHELAGFARAMRAQSHRVHASPGVLLDTCGTGAAKAKTFNVSTASAFVAAAAGIRVAKHGNRSVTRPSGSADVLEAAGATLALTPEQAARVLADVGIVFLHAPAFHPAMKHAAPVRQALGIRTVFNLLGPLCNPARATHHVLGVFDAAAVRPMAEALQLLGVREAYVLHGEPGLDDASVSGITHTLRLKDGLLARPVSFTPEDLGLPRHDPAKVGPVPKDQAAATLRAILSGEPSARADLVVANAAFALHLAGKASSLQDGVVRARQILASGRAARVLDSYVAATKAVEAPGPASPTPALQRTIQA